MQNADLRKARDELEVALEKYTDLYDFAPVGYFSLDESGVILEANLTGAALLGVERSRLINRRLLHFVAPDSRAIFLGLSGTSLRRDRETDLRGRTIKGGRRTLLGRTSGHVRSLSQGDAEMVPGHVLGHYRPQAG